MANFDDLKKLDQAKKTLKEIQELQKKITEDGRRYNKEGQLGVKARKEVLDLTGKLNKLLLMHRRVKEKNLQPHQKKE